MIKVIELLPTVWWDVVYVLKTRTQFCASLKWNFSTWNRTTQTQVRKHHAARLNQNEFLFILRLVKGIVSAAEVEWGKKFIMNIRQQGFGRRMPWTILRLWPRIHAKKLKVTTKYLRRVADNAVDIRARYIPHTKIKFSNFNVIFMNDDTDGIFQLNCNFVSVLY
jgi:hypothetical protein